MYVINCINSWRFVSGK